jgi:hypothetical protein
MTTVILHCDGFVSGYNIVGVWKVVCYIKTAIEGLDSELNRENVG